MKKLMENNLMENNHESVLAKKIFDVVGDDTKNSAHRILALNRKKKTQHFLKF